MKAVFLKPQRKMAKEAMGKLTSARVAQFRRDWMAIFTLRTAAKSPPSGKDSFQFSPKIALGKSF